MADKIVDSSVAELINKKYSKLSNSEQKVARALFADYPAAGLDTVASFAANSGVSGPTVLRFIDQLGFSSYKDFQHELREELKYRQESILTQGRRSSEASGADQSDWLTRGIEVLSTGLFATADAALKDDVEYTVEVLSNPKIQIKTLGGDYSSVLADYLVRQLIQIRGKVSRVSSSPLFLAADLTDISRGEVWVVFDLRRYQKTTMEIAKAAHDNGARIILFTDRWLSPIARFAHAVFPARVETSGPSDTIVPVLGLLEVISAQVHAKLGDNGIARMEKIDPLRIELD